MSKALKKPSSPHSSMHISGSPEQSGSTKAPACIAARVFRPCPSRLSFCCRLSNQPLEFTGSVSHPLGSSRIKRLPTSIAVSQEGSKPVTGLLGRSRHRRIGTIGSIGQVLAPPVRLPSSSLESSPPASGHSYTSLPASPIIPAKSFTSSLNSRDTLSGTPSPTI